MSDLTPLERELQQRVRAGIQRHAYTIRELGEVIGVGGNHLAQVLAGTKHGTIDLYDKMLTAVQQPVNYDRPCRFKTNGWSGPCLRPATHINSPVPEIAKHLRPMG